MKKTKIEAVKYMMDEKLGLFILEMPTTDGYDYFVGQDNYGIMEMSFGTCNGDRETEQGLRTLWAKGYFSNIAKNILEDNYFNEEV